MARSVSSQIVKTIIISMVPGGSEYVVPGKAPTNRKASIAFVTPDSTNIIISKMIVIASRVIFFT